MYLSLVAKNIYAVYIFYIKYEMYNWFLGNAILAFLFHFK